MLLFQFVSEEMMRSACEDNRDDREDTVTATEEAEDDIITYSESGQGQFARQNEEVESHVSVTVYIDTSGPTGDLVDNLENNDITEHDDNKSTNKHDDNISNNAQDEKDEETDDSESYTDDCDSGEDNEELMTDVSSNCSTPTLTTIIQVFTNIVNCHKNLTRHIEFFRMDMKVI